MPGLIIYTDGTNYFTMQGMGGSGGGAVSSVFGRIGVVAATSGDYTVAQVTGAAPIASPTFTGVPAAPTATVGTNTTQLATTAFVIANAGSGAVSSVFTRTGAVIAVSGDYTVAQITGAAPLASPTFTGVPLAPTASALTNTTQLATTAYADLAIGVEKTRALAAEALLAPLASPTLTGVPLSTTPSTSDNTTKIATTAYVKAQGYITASTITSVFGRTGVVIATSGDYTVSQITGAAPLASPTFTGTPAAPTATVGTNTTQLATTAFVLANAGSGGSFTVITKTSNYTAVAFNMVLCNTSGGGFTVTLPLSGSNTGSTIIIKKISTDANILTVNTTSSDTIDGNPTELIAFGKTTMEVLADGTTVWEIR